MLRLKVITTLVVISFLLTLSACTQEVVNTKEEPSTVSYGRPMGVAEIKVNGVEVAPDVHMRTMSDERFSMMSESNLYSFKLTLTEEQLQTLPQNRREAIQNASSTAPKDEEGIRFYMDGKEVGLAEVLKEFDPEEFKTLYSAEERQQMMQQLTSDQLNQLTVEHQNTLKAQ
jgi:hypothetical protein